MERAQLAELTLEQQELEAAIAQAIKELKKQGQDLPGQTHYKFRNHWV